WWIAPEIPTARYSWGETVLPVCPTWKACGYQPASVTARDAPTAAPRESASFSMMPNPSADPGPRPPDPQTRAAFAASEAVNATASTTAAPGDGSGEIALGRTAMTGVPARTVECTVM